VFNKLFSRLLGSSDKHSSVEAAAEHWNQWQAAADQQKPRWIDWGDHPTFLNLIYAEHFGSPDVTLFHYLKREFPFFADCRALSLCCGDGAFENLLAGNGIFGAITGIDISDYRVDKARRQYAGITNLDFMLGDINQGDYGAAAFDVVFAKAALHHIENLEAAFAGMRACLKQTGYLVTIDFFGPTRFQWTDAQLNHANALLPEIPASLRTDRNGNIKSAVTRPTVDEMITADPSEAVRSSEVHGFIARNFRIVKEFDVGGTLVNLIFTPDIINNFNPDDAGHRELIGRLYRKERELITAGELPSDFKFIIAEKR
jgi:SAM-dependent methyltransferase